MEDEAVVCETAAEKERRSEFCERLGVVLNEYDMVLSVLPDQTRREWDMFTIRDTKFLPSYVAVSFLCENGKIKLVGPACQPFKRNEVLSADRFLRKLKMAGAAKMAVSLAPLPGPVGGVRVRFDVPKAQVSISFKVE